MQKSVKFSDTCYFLLRSVKYIVFFVLCRNCLHGEIEGIIMSQTDSTQFFDVRLESDISVREVLNSVYEAMIEKGYNPVNQIVGYIMSGDPTYVTSHKGARSKIMKVERDELVEELLRDYIRHETGKEV